jgi:hypothetical protein
MSDVATPTADHTAKTHNTYYRQSGFNTLRYGFLLPYETRLLLESVEGLAHRRLFPGIRAEAVKLPTYPGRLASRGELAHMPHRQKWARLPRLARGA